MIDNVNPTNQFHPYQRPMDTPVAERQASGLSSSLNKMRDYAKARPGILLGGLAAAAIGLGMLRRGRSSQ
jgi:hypothetical protein